MLFQNWLSSLATRCTRHSRKARRRQRLVSGPSLQSRSDFTVSAFTEKLEDRTLLSSITLIDDVNATPADSTPQNFVQVGTLTFFTASTPSTGLELWVTDGTSGGTTMLADIRQGSSGSGPNQLTNVSGTLFFNANDGVNGSALWKSDGTAAGTVLVADPDPENAN